MKKRIFSLFLAVVMVALLLPVQAFAAPKEIKGAYVNQNFETVIDTVVGATTYSKSGNLPEGMKLGGSYSYKNTFGDYVMKMSLSGIPTTAGTYNFSVTYKKNDGTVVTKADYSITVGAKAPYAFVDSIHVEKWPDKTVYYLGDTIDLTGMVVTAIVYNFDEASQLYKPEEIDVTDLVWVEPAVFTSDEAQTVYVYLKAPADQDGTLKVFESHFRVTFNYANPEDVTRIEVYQKPTKLTYTVGEKLDTTGLVVRLHKGNGSAEDITTGFTTDVTTLDTVGTQTVTVKYTENGKEFTATFDVTVEEKPVESSSSSSSEPESTSSSSSSSEPEPETSSSVPEDSSSEPESESSSEPSSEPDEVTSSEPESESSSEPEDIDVMGDTNEPSDDDEGGIPFWAWIIIVLLVILIGAAVALFLIGRKRLDDEY